MILFCLNCCIIHPQIVFESLTPLFLSFLLPDAALCPSAAWSRSCRIKSGPATQEWRESTSTKGYECAAPSSKHCHNTAAGSVLTSLPALLIQCAKVKFVSPHFHLSDGHLMTPSLGQFFCNKMFALSVWFYCNCKRFSPTGPDGKDGVYHDRYSGLCVLCGHFIFMCSIFFKLIIWSYFAAKWFLYSFLPKVGRQFSSYLHYNRSDSDFNIDKSKSALVTSAVHAFAKSVLTLF